MKTITFPENEIPYYQDFRVHKGIPAGVEFTVESKTDTDYWLVADGYGRKGNYGNGSITVRIEKITPHFLASL